METPGIPTRILPSLEEIIEIFKPAAPATEEPAATTPQIPIFKISIALVAGTIAGMIILLLKRRTIKVGVMPDEAALPYYVAARDGIFADHGVRVEVVPFQSAAERDNALTAGKIDAAESDPVGAILLRNAGFDAKIISIELKETPDKLRFAIVASSGSDISSVGDLEGRKIAIPRGTMIEYVTDALLGDVDMEKVAVDEVSAQMQMVLDNVETTALPEPLVSYAIHRGAMLIISDAMLNRGISQTVMVSSGKFIKKNPKRMAKFFDAYREAVERINAAPENCRALLVETVRIPEEIAESYTIATYLQPQPYPRENFEAVIHWMRSRDLVQEDIPYTDMVQHNNEEEQK